MIGSLTLGLKIALQLTCTMLNVIVNFLTYFWLLAVGNLPWKYWSYSLNAVLSG